MSVMSSRLSRAIDHEQTGGGAYRPFCTGAGSGAGQETEDPDLICAPHESGALPLPELGTVCLLVVRTRSGHAG
jgi:hypothetical protein